MTPADLRPAPLTGEFMANAAAAWCWALHADPIMCRAYLRRLSPVEREDVALAADQLRAFALAEEDQ